MATHALRIGSAVRRVALFIVFIGGAWVAAGAASVSYAQGIEEIIVTARKRAESLQDVPLSIVAMTSEQMRELGIRNNYDVAAFTPNFNTVQRVGRAGDRPVIRGMANPPDPNQGEPNASYFIDGVFVSSTIATATTASMERVEVLRGPQSAQFGRATFSGAVNYITRKPTNEFEGEAKARYGSSDEMQFSGWVSGPIVRDRLLFLLSASHEQYGGQWKNNLQANSAFVNGGTADFVFDGQNTEGDTTELGEEETNDFLAKLTWTPGDSTEVNLKLGFTEGDDSLYPTNVLPNNVSDFANLNCFIPDDPAEPWYETSHGEFCGEFKEDGTENRKNLPDLRNGIFAESPLGDLAPEDRAAAPAKPGLRRESKRLMGEWIQGFGEWTSVVRASYSKDDFDNVIDFDQQEVRAVWGLFAFYIKDQIKDQSIEFSVSSPDRLPVRGKLGAYYFDREDARIERSFTGPAPVFGVEPGADFGAPRELTIENVSVFGSVSFDLAPRWTLDMEARYAEDEKEITSGQRSIADNSIQPNMLAQNFSSFTPRLTLSFQPTDDILTYGLIAKGNKPGDFNKDLFRSDIPAEFTDFQINCEIGDVFMNVECTELLKSDLTIKEEEQWTYEFGLKSTWFNRSVTANLAMFYIDWENQALTEVAETPTSSGTTTGLQVLRNVGRSKVIRLELETSWAATDNLFLFFNYGLADGEFVEGALPNFADTTGTDGDIAGHTIPDTPTHSVVTGFDARAPIKGDLQAFLRGNLLFESKRYNNASNLAWMDQRKLVNFRVGVESDAWTATVYVRNLLDDDTPIGALRFNNFAINPISTVAGAANDEDYPSLYSIVPTRGRDYGLEISYRFGR